MAPVHFRVFLSSPGDVQDERSLARKVIESLPKQPFIRNRATLEVVSWDDPDAPAPVYANLTPQAALRRHMKLPSECDIVVVVLWSRLGTPLPENDNFYRKPDGGRYLSGTEWEFADAVRAGKAVLAYRRSEKPKVEIDDPNFQTKLQQYSRVTQFFQRFTSGDGSLNGLWRQYEAPSEFERLLDNDIRAVLEDLLTSQQSAAEADPASVVAADADRSPYPGLRRLTEQDEAMFFGRGREVDALVKTIADGQRFVSVIGASGSGKSSLVRAGLLPRLRGNAVYGSKDWKFITFAPADLGDNPFLALAAALTPLLPYGRSPIQLADEMSTDPSAATRVCNAALSGSSDWVKLLIAIDQFEELFTVAAATLRDAFARAIDALAEHPRVVIISTLRTDFFANVTNWGRLADLMRDGHYLLMPPGLRALSDIIALPASRAGIALEPGLLERIIEDAGLQPGTLPLLAYTLEQLYNAGKGSHALTHSNYESLGGLRGAISKRAEESLRMLDATATAELPRLFRQLLTVNSAGIVTRRRALQRDVAINPQMATLVRTLVDARLLIADRRDDENTIEVAHEALFEGWDQMRAWVADNREYLLWRNRLQLRLEDWRASGRDENSALQGGPLQEAFKWLERNPEDLTDEERAFIRWPLSDEFQIRRVIATARDMLASTADRVTRERQRAWLTSLILAGEEKEIDLLTCGPLLIGNELAEARIDAAVLLARAGDLDAAVAMVGELTDIGRAEAGARVAEIAASSGQPEAATSAAMLIGDEQLSKRVLARAAACGGGGQTCQFLVEILSHALPSAPVTAYLQGKARLAVDWAEAVAGAKSIVSPILRAGVVTTTMSALGVAGQRDVARSLVPDLEASLGSLEESYWRGLATVRVVDAMGAAGLSDEAGQLAQQIQAGGHRAHARALLALHHVTRGAHDGAVALASEALDDISSSGAMEPGLERVIAVAGLLGRAGKVDEGKRLATNALETATMMSVQTPSPSVLGRVAQALALCGALEDTARVLARISVLAGRGEALRTVARTVAEHGYADRVMVLAHMTGSSLERAELLACAADAWPSESASSRGELAGAILDAIAASPDRRRAYSHCIMRTAAALIACGKVSELMNAMRAIEGKHERAEAWITVMERLAGADRHVEALELADDSLPLIDALDDHDERARGFAHVARVIARCGRLEKAHRVSRRCHLTDEKLSVLTDILRSWISRERYPKLADIFWDRQMPDDPQSTPARLAGVGRSERFHASTTKP